MTREEAIWWVNHLFEIRKEEYLNKRMMEDAKEVEQAQHMAIEALSADAVSLTGTMKYLTKPHNYCEVVRCKDCLHNVLTKEGEYNPQDIVCDYWMSDGLDSNDFCSYGERREQ